MVATRQEFVATRLEFVATRQEFVATRQKNGDISSTPGVCEALPRKRPVYILEAFAVHQKLKGTTADTYVPLQRNCQEYIKRKRHCV